MNFLQKYPQTIIANNILREQYKRTRTHLGIECFKEIKELSMKIIASYGAEGIIFDKLKNERKFSSCIWLNIEEVDQRTVEISNCLRLKSGLERMPMIFLKIK